MKTVESSAAETKLYSINELNFLKIYSLRTQSMGIFHSGTYYSFSRYRFI